MFYYLKGKLANTTAQTAVVECGGVGFLLTVSTNTLSHLTKMGEEVKLYTYMSVREDAMELYGFFTESELDMFKQLINVSGVGPKAAISLLSAFSPERLASAIVTGDVKMISGAKGIGKKTAERIILELKERIALISSEEGTEVLDLSSAGNASSIQKDVIDGLMVLGISKADAVRVVKDCTGTTIEEVMREALRRYNSGK
ncbi:MAG: Holliday junction branch migration protein RuvA [Clostridiales bacterium]|nr:Holliday junction branch migration protein RuvA [Clostridiales bacterium]